MKIVAKIAQQFAQMFAKITRIFLFSRKILLRTCMLMAKMMNCLYMSKSLFGLNIPQYSLPTYMRGWPRRRRQQETCRPGMQELAARLINRIIKKFHTSL
jgi:hypothetical protein